MLRIFDYNSKDENPENKTSGTKRYAHGKPHFISMRLTIRAPPDDLR